MGAAPKDQEAGKLTWWHIGELVGVVRAAVRGGK